MNGFLIQGAIYSSLTHSSGHAAFLFKLFFGKRTHRKTEGRRQTANQQTTSKTIAHKKPCLEIPGRVLVW
jgi:hypothetical protein